LYDTVKAPYTDPKGCMAFNNLGHPNVHNCECTKCFSLVQQCDALPGCQAIVKCTLDSGCAKTAASAAASRTSCYFTGVCSPPIDTWGTGSVSTGLSDALGQCGITNNCPRQ
jgi:hypothetical protein